MLVWVPALGKSCHGPLTSATFWLSSFLSGLRVEPPCSQRAEGNAHKGGRIRAGVAKAQGSR